MAYLNQSSQSTDKPQEAVCYKSKNLYESELTQQLTSIFSGLLESVQTLQSLLINEQVLQSVV